MPPTSSADIRLSFEPLRALLAILTDSVAALEATFADAQLQFPQLAQPYQPANGEQLLLNSDDARRAAIRITAACEQLVATVRTPMESLCDAAMAYNLPACLSVMERTNTVEILRKAGPRGLHVADICAAAPGEIDPGVLARILRLLATHNLLVEVSPDRFANNRISSFLDSGKDVEAIRASPHLKYDDTNGVSAFVGLCTDEIFKASAYLTNSLGLALEPCAPSPQVAPFPSLIQAPLEIAIETSFNPIHAIRQHVSLPPKPADRDNDVYHWRPHSHARTLWPAKPPSATPVYSPASDSFDTIGLNSCPSESHSQEHSPFKLAFNTREAYFNWLELPQHQAHLRRFGVAMRGTAEWEMGGVVKGFDWTSLEPGSTIVDVGGGFGSACKTLIPEFPHFRYIVQDTPKVVEVARQIWQDRLSGCIPEGTLTFENHDFFQPQRLEAPPAVFLLRAICHDWPDDDVLRILTNLRRAAGPNTRLVLGDHVMPYACVDNEKYDGIPGAFTSLTDKTSEAALLPNLGRGSANAYWLDLCMQNMFCSQERTLKHTVALTQRAGWSVLRVNRVDHSLFGYVICKPFDIPEFREGCRL